MKKVSWKGKESCRKAVREGKRKNADPTGSFRRFVVMMLTTTMATKKMRHSNGLPVPLCFLFVLM